MTSEKIFGRSSKNVSSEMSQQVLRSETQEEILILQTNYSKFRKLLGTNDIFGKESKKRHERFME